MKPEQLIKGDLYSDIRQQDLNLFFDKKDRDYLVLYWKDDDIDEYRQYFCDLIDDFFYDEIKNNENIIYEFIEFAKKNNIILGNSVEKYLNEHSLIELYNSNNNFLLFKNAKVTSLDYEYINEFFKPYLKDKLKNLLNR